MKHQQPAEIISAAGLPSSVTEVVRLFSEELVEVSFPDLGPGALEAGIEAVSEHLERLVQARDLLHSREAELEACKEALVRACERGLGYARVYAADNDALRATVDSIKGLRPPPPAPPRVRRSRAPKSSMGEPPAEQLSMRNPSEPLGEGGVPVARLCAVG